MKYEVILQIESEEKEKEVSDFLSGILDVTKHSDTISVGNIAVNKSTDKSCHYGICKIWTGSTLRLDITSWKPNLDGSQVRAKMLRGADPYESNRHDVKIIESFRSDRAFDALMEHLSTDKLRKIINDAINSRGEDTAGEGKEGKT